MGKNIRGAKMKKTYFLVKNFLKDKNNCKNLFYGSMASMMPMLLTAIAAIFLAKFFSPGEYSKIPKIFAFLAFMELGLGLLNTEICVRGIIKKKKSAFAMSSVFWGRLILSFVLLAIGIVVMFLRGNSFYLTFFLLWFVLFYGFYEGIILIQRANENFKVIGKYSFVYSLLFVIFVVGLAYAFKSVIAVGFAYFLSIIIVLAIFFPDFKKIKKSIDFAFLKGILLISSPLMILVAVDFILKWYGVVYLSVFSAAQDLSYYYMSSNIARFHLIVPILAAFVFFPRLAKKGLKELKSLYFRFNLIVFIYAVLSFLIIYFVILPLIVGFIGSGYSSLLDYYPFWSLWIVFACLSYSLGMFLFVQGLTKQITVAQVLQSVLMIFFIYFFFKLYGPTGVIIGTGLAQFIGFLVLLIFWKVHLNKNIKKEAI
jgi:O-antigen/teichoic acid export membrane protein